MDEGFLGFVENCYSTSRSRFSFCERCEQKFFASKVAECTVNCRGRAITPILFSPLGNSTLSAECIGEVKSGRLLRAEGRCSERWNAPEGKDRGKLEEYLGKWKVLKWWNFSGIYKAS